MDLEAIKKNHLEAVHNLADSLMTNRQEQIRQFVNLDCKELIAEVERLREENEKAWQFIHTIERFVVPGTDHERWRYMPLERLKELAREKGILPPEQG